MKTLILFTINIFIVVINTHSFSYSTLNNLNHHTVIQFPKENDISSNNEVITDINVHNIPNPKFGVLLLQLGCPLKNNDVQPFLYNLFNDPNIIRLPTLLKPFQSFIAYLISKTRSKKAKKAYESIGGGSPLFKYTKEQANSLKKNILQKHNVTVNTYIGMNYFDPYIRDTIQQIYQDDLNKLVILPLYPQFSISTTGSSLHILKNEPLINKIPHTVISCWYDRPNYHQCTAQEIMENLQEYTSDQIDYGHLCHKDNISLHVLFSAHGVPVSYVQDGDPYQLQIESCVENIGKIVGKKNNIGIHLSYQSRVGPIQWLQPSTEDYIKELGKDGVKNLVVVPISFVSEHIETLEEIDMEYKELARESGILNWKRCRTFCSKEGFISDLSDMVIEALKKGDISVKNAFDSKEMRCNDCRCKKVGDK